jgi:hypothetical protein
MSGRRRSRMLRDPETRPTIANTYLAKTSDQAATAISQDTGTSSAILTSDSIKKINAINYVNQFYPQLQIFLKYFHEQFFNIIDMITNAVDIHQIIEAAKALRTFINSEVQSLNYIPGAGSLIDELVRCESLLLDIMEDLISCVEPGIIVQRVNYMKALLTKINESFRE